MKIPKHIKNDLLYGDMFNDLWGSSGVSGVSGFSGGIGDSGVIFKKYHPVNVMGPKL